MCGLLFAVDEHKFVVHEYIVSHFGIISSCRQK